MKFNVITISFSIALCLFFILSSRTTDAFGTFADLSKYRGFGCFSHYHCTRNERCVNFQCTLKCENDHLCSYPDRCVIRNRQQVCDTPKLADTGKEFCNTNSQCPDYEQCINNKCDSACKNIKCGDNTNCYTANHVAQCECLPGYEFTNDGRNCVKKSRSFVKTKKSSVCFKNEDCKDDEECAQNKCVPSCERAPGCGLDNTRCNAANHAHTCECLSGFYGNPYSIDGCY